VTATLWFVIVGALLLGMGATTGFIRRLPLTTAMIYFAVGYLMDPAGISFAALDPVLRPELLERISEIAVLVSLFTAGLKLRAPFGGPRPDRRWATPVRLATVSMVITVAAVTALAYWGLRLPLGAAVLLGAVLAPTDPVLASDVQVAHPEDRDRLRFSLTGEAGLNDGTAFPFIMLGLGLLGLHDIGEYGWRWVAIDLVWAVISGVAVGAFLGWATGRVVLRLRAAHRERVGTDDLLVLGLISFSYGLALLVKGYGFLAVFAAGLALRRAEERHAALVGDARPGALATSEGAAPERAEGAAVDQPEAQGPSQPYMVEEALGVVEQLERIGEAAVVLLLGGLFTGRFLALDAWWFVLALFFVVRPVAVWAGVGRRGSPIQRRLAMWFGIRGIGSVYYLCYGIAHGVPAPLAERLVAITFTTIVASLLVHGISVTPLMKVYERSSAGRAGRDGASSGAPAQA
jgi:NhaP-type Na+/H+ or K+/H+ antiporter